MDVDFDNELLKDGLRSVRDQRTPRLLRDFTDWSWDTVYLFHEWADGDSIEQTVGAPVISSRIFDSKASLLVFAEYGIPVRAVGIGGDFVRGSRASWTADAIVEPWGNGFVALA